MTRTTQETEFLPNGDETHPAFGTVTVVRASGSPRSLFQSDLLHNETIQLSVNTATRKRNLAHDWVHPHTEIIEIEMSLAQWGALISSMGQGSGTPVTIRRTCEDGLLPDIPHQPRLSEGLDEVRESTGKLLDRVRRDTERLHEAVHDKQGVRATKDALRDLESTLANAESNQEFVVRSLNEAGEHVVSQAKADIESFLLQAQHRAGLEQGPIENPKEIED